MPSTPDLQAKKARQRERNKEAGQAGTRSGSSGITGLVREMEKHSYDEIAESAIDGPEFAGVLTDLRVLANRTISLSIIVPAAYSHEVMDLAFDSQTMFTFFRASHVPHPSMLPEPTDEEGD